MQNKTIKKIFICSENVAFFEDIQNKIMTPDVKKWFKFEFIKSDYDQIHRQHQILEIYQQTFNCDTFIYDMNNCDLELLEFQIEVFSSVELEKPKHLLLLSNILTWERTEKVASQTEQDDNKSVLNDIQFLKSQRQQKKVEADENQQNQEIDDQQNDNEFQPEFPEDEQTENQQFVYYKNSDFLKRKCNSDYINFVSIENLVYALTQTKKNFSANIICPGILYGYNQQQLFEIFKNSWLHEPPYLQQIVKLEKGQQQQFLQNICNHNQQKLTKIDLLNDDNQIQDSDQQEQKEDVDEDAANIQNNSTIQITNNEIPMIHYEDLLLHIKFIITQELKNIFYIFCIDQNKQRTQSQIIKAISEGFNSGEIQKVIYKECTYNENLKRLLILDAKVLPSNIFNNYNKQKELYQTYKQELEEIDKQNQEKENEEIQKEENQEEDQEEDNEIVQKRKFVQEFKDIDYSWHNINGICTEIQKIKQEFIEYFDLKSNKICIFGSPFSGKSTIAQKLSNFFELPIIRKQDLIQKYQNIDDEFGQELKAYIEEKNNEFFVQNEEREEKKKKQRKKMVFEKTGIQPEFEIPFEMLIKMYKRELRNNKYTNRGYILDGLPETYKEFYYMFKINQKNEEEEDVQLDDIKEVPEEIDQRFLNFQQFDKKILDKDISPTCIIDVKITDQEQELFFINKKDNKFIDYNQTVQKIQKWRQQFENKEVQQCEDFANEESIKYIKIHNEYQKDVSSSLIKTIQDFDNYKIPFKGQKQDQNIDQNKTFQDKENLNIQNIQNKKEVIQREIMLKIEQTRNLEFYEKVL